MVDKPKLWSISALSRELGRNERTLARALAGVQHDGRLSSGHPGWTLRTVWQALETYGVNGSGHNGHRSAAEEDDYISDAQCDAALQATDAVQSLLEKLRKEPSVERRRALFQRDGRAIGALDRAVTATLVDDPLREVHRPFLRKAVGQEIAEMLASCNLRLEPSGG